VRSFSEILAASTVLLGGFSAASYAFALGYIFAIEPRYLPFFTIGDLLFLFVSSTSSVIFVSMVLIPTLAFVLSQGVAVSFYRKTGRLLEHHLEYVTTRETDDPQAPDTHRLQEAVSPPNALPLREWTSTLIALSVTFAMVIVAFQELFISEPAVSSVFPEPLVVFGMVLILLPAMQSMRMALPVITFLYVLAAFYALGDVSGKRDLVGSPQSRGMPCAFINSGPRCFDVLLIGSDAAILRHDGQVILVPRGRLHNVQKRKPEPSMTRLVAPNPAPTV
jgi:hypothetical protein